MYLNQDYLSNLPVELKLHILFQIIKPQIYYQNTIYCPLQGLKEFLSTIVLINRKFYALKEDIIRMFKNIAKEKFSKNIYEKYRNTYKLNKELEKIFNKTYDFQFSYEKDERKAAKLIIAGANPNLLVEYKKTNNKKEKIPLLLALSATNKFTKLAKLLIAYEAEVDIKDINGITILMYAACQSNKELVELLIKNNIGKVNAQDNEGDTALILAIPNQNIVTLLISYNADINIKNNLGITPLMRAIQKSSQETVIQLINAGANVNAKSNLGITPLIIATDQGDREIVETLIRNRANVNDTNNHGLTPLMIAIQKSDQDMVIQLINSGANVNAKANLGSTPLIIATNQGNSALVETLIRHGANVNDTNNNGITPLMIAVHKGYDEIINILLSNNAAIDIQNIRGQTAQEMALPSKKEKILKLFKLYKKKATKSCQLY